jgi:hypothetical protein
VIEPSDTSPELRQLCSRKTPAVFRLPHSIAALIKVLSSTTVQALVGAICCLPLNLMVEKTEWSGSVGDGAP